MRIALFLCFLALLASSAVQAFPLQTAVAFEAPESTTIAPVNWTPLLVYPDATTQLFKGSEGQYHCAYDAVLTNFNRHPTIIREISVLDADNPNHVLVSLQGGSLKKVLAPLASSTNTLGPGEAAALFLNLAFASATDAPQRLIHRVVIESSNPDNKPQTLTYDAGVTVVDHKEPIKIGPPLRGGPWIAFGGYVGTTGHRRAFFPIDDHLINAQRYAIDWTRLDANKHSCSGDPTKCVSSASYGQDVIAVADGTVSGIISKFADQVPGQAKGEERISFPGGNSVILDIGNGLYAFYAHLKPGSILVSEGEKVKRGQKLGEVGNSGNSTGPHLHMHILTGPSMLSQRGVPYVFDSFVVTGAVGDIDKFMKNDEEAKAQEIMPPQLPGAHSDELPREGTVLLFR